jgi:alkanesulfonate monooxygenase SsuD/methylene tetrahydromethanopterin reductase-like flavin-dependent oxidoreductase (luciferase family)
MPIRAILCVMEIAVSLEVQEGLTYDEALTVARLADMHGIDGLLLAEHYYSTSAPGSPTIAPDAWIYLSALARDTTRLRLGTLVSPVTFRHPSVYAKMAATLDQISGGRAELGLGAGWMSVEHEAYGFPFPDGPTRVSMLEEQLRIITGLWAKDRFSFSGRYYSLNSCTFNPRCQQQPRVPVLVGGRPTSRRLLTLAARFADEYVVTRATPEQCRSIRSELDSHTVHRAYRRAVRLGLVMRLALQNFKEAGHYTGRISPSTSNDQWLVGTVSQVRRRLGRLERVGVDRVYISLERADQIKAVMALVDR